MIKAGHLRGEVALVTGATSGIGRAIATLFAEEGASVVAVGRREVEGRALVAETVARRLALAFVPGDVSTQKGAEAGAHAAARLFGGLTIVVNNAADFSFANIEGCSEEEWDRIMRVNVKSVFLVSKASLPFLREAGHGSIVNVSSNHALATMEKVAAYATSKAAVLGLTRQMALDYAPDNIRVNAMIVGGVDTAMSRRHYEALGLDQAGAAFRPGDHQIGRVAEPREIAQAALFLASSASSFVTGSPLIVDGGSLARLN
jgi:NAD(P)-dependent dehydrogenase (short-subunit alcohol dehydrogenase family)